MIRKNMKLLVGIVMGLIVSGFGVYAANSLSANSINIDKSKMSKVENSNLQSALDYLYSQSEKTNMITIESGVKHETQTYLGIAYLDPTNLERKCSEADEKLNRNNDGSITGVKSGCMKWYIYKDLGDSYKMILDHNTTAQVAWNTISDESHLNGTNVALDESNIKPLLTSLVNDSGWAVEPDIISAEEVAEIVGYNGFTNANELFYLDSKNQTRTNTTQGTSEFAWLFDNLGWNNWSDYICTNYGCNIWDGTNTAGYWTKTIFREAGSGSRVWRIMMHGVLDNRSYAGSDNAGLRPVITISKDLFNL